MERKVLSDFGCQKFVYCSDAGLASKGIREFNHMGERAFIVTQSIKKLKEEYRENALDSKGFRRLSDNRPADLSRLTDDDFDSLFYKEIEKLSNGHK